MSNTSSTGGYLIPGALPLYPGSLTLKQFLQTMLVGVSGLDGAFVRPRWQKDEPKQPDIDTNWLAFGVTESDGDTFSFNGVDPDGVNTTQRAEGTEIQCAFYGPDSFEIARQVRDGLGIPQNLEALQAVDLSVVSCGKILHVPDLVNERWVEKWEMSVFIRQTIKRSYPILNFASASGAVKAQLNEASKTVAWSENA